MIPTIVQRPKVFDVLEIQSGTLPAICCWLEMMEFKVLYLMPKLHSAKRHRGIVATRRVLFGVRLPIPFASRLRGHRPLGLNQ